MHVLSLLLALAAAPVVHSSYADALNENLHVHEPILIAQNDPQEMLRREQAKLDAENAEKEKEEQAAAARAQADAAEDAKIGSNPRAVRLALVTLVCEERFEKEDAMKAISEEKARARMGGLGVIDLDLVHTKQAEAYEHLKRSKAYEAKLRAQHFKMLSCDSDPVIGLVNCYEGPGNDGCSTAPIPALVRLVQRLELPDDP